MFLICAPRASVLPPAPAQKSTTISPRRAPVSSARSWLPSSCTSTRPCSKTSVFCSAGLPTTRMPSGEYGVAAASKPATRRRSSTSSRSALSALTRRSSGAGVSTASTQSQNSSPRRACSGTASQSGRLWRRRSGSAPRSKARQRASHSRSRSSSAALRTPALPCQTSSARRRSISPRPPFAELARWRQSGSFLRSAKTPSASRWRSRAPRARCSRKKSATTRSAGCSKRSTRCTSSVCASSRAVGCMPDYPCRPRRRASSATHAS